MAAMTLAGWNYCVEVHNASRGMAVCQRCHLNNAHTLWSKKKFPCSLSELAKFCPSPAIIVHSLKKKRPTVSAKLLADFNFCSI